LDTSLGLIVVLLRALYHVSTPVYPVVAFYGRTML
jgi:xanthosine utilization system XapX-like protein